MRTGFEREIRAVSGRVDRHDADAFLKLLSQTLTIKEGNGERVIRYDHVTALPVPEGAVGVPEVVIAYLTATDGGPLLF